MPRIWPISVFCFYKCVHSGHPVHPYDEIKAIIGCYVKYFNTQRPCYAIEYDTPENYRKRYYKGELGRKDTFKDRNLTPESKFVQKRREASKNQDIEEQCPLLEMETAENDWKCLLL